MKTVHALLWPLLTVFVVLLAAFALLYLRLRREQISEYKASLHTERTEQLPTWKGETDA